MASSSRSNSTPTRGSPLRSASGSAGLNNTAAASFIPQAVPRPAHPPAGQTTFTQQPPSAFLPRSPPRGLPFNFPAFPSVAPPFRPNSRGGPQQSSQLSTSTHPIVHNSGGGLTWTTDDALAGDPASEWSICGLDIPLARIRHLVEETDGDLAVNEATSPRPFSSMSMGHASQIAAYAFGGEARWQFEMIRNANVPTTSTAPAPPSDSIHDPLLQPPPVVPQNPGALSLYLTCNLVDRDYPAASLTIPATIMIGLREKGMRRPAHDRWLWRKWETVDFTPEREYWQNHSMPPLSSLLGEGQDLDDLVLSLQINSPTGQAAPQFEDSHVVPRALLSGIESLLDDPGTGDVLITVCERALASTSTAHHGDLASLSVNDGEPAPLYRRRVIYAHSALLKARSGYFDSMLGSDHWSEAGETVAGRRRHRLTITDFPFETVWWLLRWIYTNEVSFVDQPDVRNSAFDELPDGALGTGPSSIGWTWQHLPSASRRAASDSEQRSVFGRVTPTSPAGRTSPVQVLGGFNTSSPSGKRPRGGGKAPETEQPPTSPTPSASTSKQPAIVSPADPHAHPTSAPPPTSALDVYRLAHRCELTPLTTLALDHLVSTLTPRTAFPLLLISYLWPDLHQAVQRYTINNWTTILALAQVEVKQCFVDVADGVYPSGGQTLFEFTQLLSQSGLPPPRV